MPRLQQCGRDRPFSRGKSRLSRRGVSRRWLSGNRPAQGGTLDGLLKTLSGWTDDKFRVVPARGKVTTGATVKVFRDMIATVRDRVQQMISSGQSEKQILTEHPTTDFDATWGHGRIQADAFVREVYDALTERR
ncbi:MAG TPA: hypothetical protein VIH58_04330 [Chthoniobacterales bacterium]